MHAIRRNSVLIDIGAIKYMQKLFCGFGDFEIIFDLTSKTLYNSIVCNEKTASMSLLPSYVRKFMTQKII